MKVIAAIWLILQLINLTPAFGFQMPSAESFIQLNKKKSSQTIRAISGNYAQANYTDNIDDEVGNKLLEVLSPKHVRIAVPLRYWEPENDNENPYQANQEGFERHQHRIASLMKLLQKLKASGVKEITASVWDAPDWLVANPQERNKRIVPFGLYPELIESISAFMQYAKDSFQLTFDYFSFNEASGGYQLLFSPEEMIAFIKMAGPRWQAMGFKTKFLTGDTHSTATCVPYCQPLLENTLIRKFLGPIAYHSWWSDNLPDTAFEEIAQLAQKYNKEVWCTEVGFDAMLYQKKGAMAAWETAWKLAIIHHRVLKHSKATITHYWTYQRNFSLLDSTLSPYPSFYVLKHLTEIFPEGVTMIGAKTTNDRLLVMAAKGKRKYFSIQVINTADVPIKIKIAGLENRHSYRWVTTTEHHNFREQGVFVPREDLLTIILPAKSINSFSPTTKMP